MGVVAGFSWALVRFAVGMMVALAPALAISKLMASNKDGHSEHGFLLQHGSAVIEGAFKTPHRAKQPE